MIKLATFHTQTGAIKFDRKLKTLGLDTVLKPVPRVLSSSCGICVEFQAENIDQTDIEDLDKLYHKQETGYDLIFASDDN